MEKSFTDTLERLYTEDEMLARTIAIATFLIMELGLNPPDCERVQRIQKMSGNGKIDRDRAAALISAYIQEIAWSRGIAGDRPNEDDLDAFYES